MAKTDILNAVLLHCPTCKPHEYQDSQYGAKIRVYNMMGTGPQFRCTVCSRETA